MNIQKTNEKINLDQVRASNLSNNSNYIVKTLNNPAKLLIIFGYTLLITGLTITFSKAKTNSDLKAQLNEVKKSQSNIAKTMDRSLKRISEDLQYRPSLMNLESKLVSELTKKLSVLSDQDKKIIEDQKQSIFELKQKLNNLLELRANIDSTEQKTETLAYSLESFDVLYYKHQQVLNRLKSKNKQKEEAFISLFDMASNSNQEKLADFKEKLDLEYYSKKRELSAIREKFRSQKFINIVANK